MEHWHLVQTKSGQERRVAVRLHQLGHLAYVPLIWSHPERRRRASRERPYFPGYVFVKLDANVGGVDAVRWLPGAKQLVEYCDERVCLSDAFIAELKHRLERVQSLEGTGLEHAHRRDWLPAYPSPFEGFQGLFSLRLTGIDRSRILLACVERYFLRHTEKSRSSVEKPNDQDGSRSGW